MRHHDPYTDYVIEKLEEQNLEVIRDPVTDWLDYVNKMSQRNSMRDLKLAIRNCRLRKTLVQAGKFVRSFIKGGYMSHIEEKIAEPFHEVLHSRSLLPEPIKIIETLEQQHEFHGNIEGESPLSTGIAYYVMHGLTKPRGNAYLSGIFHVGPFTCMQEGVATAKIEAMAKEFRKKKSDLVFPIIHAFFGDSPNPNLDAEIAVFKEQCEQNKEMLKARHEPGASKSPKPKVLGIKPAEKSFRAQARYDERSAASR
jgi:hypothetical protein